MPVSQAKSPFFWCTFAAPLRSAAVRPADSDRRQNPHLASNEDAGTRSGKRAGTKQRAPIGVCRHSFKTASSIVNQRRYEQLR
jgi:hypothetical protein